MGRRLLKKAWKIFTVSPWQSKAMALAQEGMCNRSYLTMEEDGYVRLVHPCGDKCLWLDAYYETINP